MSAGTASAPRLSLLAQTFAAVIEHMHPSALRNPGSREFRAAFLAAARSRGLDLNPSRAETRRAVAELIRAGRYHWATAATVGSTAGAQSTSALAYESLSGRQIGASHRHVLGALSHRPMTNDEILAEYEANGSLFGNFTPERLRAARAELEYAGMVVGTGKRRTTRTGRLAEVYALVDGEAGPDEVR